MPDGGQAYGLGSLDMIPDHVLPPIIILIRDHGEFISPFFIPCISCMYISLVIPYSFLMFHSSRHLQGCLRSSNFISSQGYSMEAWF